jgi:hypothetical protein
VSKATPKGHHETIDGIALLPRGQEFQRLKKLFGISEILPVVRCEGVFLDMAVQTALALCIVIDRISKLDKSLDHCEG